MYMFVLVILGTFPRKLYSADMRGLA